MADSVVEHEFRAYDPLVDEFTDDGYPLAWRYLKHIVRENGEHRCARCKHPYRGGEHGNGEWSRCDEHCTHHGPVRWPGLTREWNVVDLDPMETSAGWLAEEQTELEAQWRILTVHHLDGDKANCRWWNLVPLCQRCHLTIQGKVYMDRPYNRPHSEWFRPFVAGFYAFKYLGADLTREQVTPRMAELLDLELRQDRLPSF